MRHIMLVTICLAVVISCKTKIESKKEENNFLAKDSLFKNGQQDKKENNSILFINNTTLKHHISLVACKNCAPITSTFQVVVELTESERIVISKISHKEWMSLLNNEKSDWAANLILYYLFRRNAVFLKQFYTRKQWLYLFKKEDLEYWDIQLSDTKKK